MNISLVQPFHFVEPPTARVHGVIPMHGEDNANLQFDLEGGPFHWWKFKIPHVSGHVHWAGKSLTLTNVNADFYGGQATGFADFDFRPKRGDDFQLRVTHGNRAADGIGKSAAADPGRHRRHNRRKLQSVNQEGIQDSHGNAQ